MAFYSQIEENYLKTILKLELEGDIKISTSAIAQALNLQAASVTEMIKRLSSKGLIHYIPYQGVSLSKTGKKIAVNIVRKHRLWEVFLAQKLQFRWNEIHDLAEQLEHIQSDELIDRLDNFLGNPAFDPHGGPIPDRDGNIQSSDRRLLSSLSPGTHAIIIGVKDDSGEFLRILEKLELLLGSEVLILQQFEYDQSLLLQHGSKTLNISSKVADNLWVKCH